MPVVTSRSRPGPDPRAWGGSEQGRCSGPNNIGLPVREFVIGRRPRGRVAGVLDEPARIPGQTRCPWPVAVSRAGSNGAGRAEAVWLGDLRRGGRPNGAPLSLAVPNLGRSVVRRYGGAGGPRHGTIAGPSTPESSGNRSQLGRGATEACAGARLQRVMLHCTIFPCLSASAWLSNASTRPQGRPGRGQR
jgi:hypothetical protein